MIKMDEVVKRLVIPLGFFQIVFEFNSIRMLLWPLNHSCAKSKHLVESSSSTIFDSSKQPIDLDTMQTNLFDATPEDITTVARASAMGINYEDIASCFEYQIDYNSTSNETMVNMESLEACRYGLHFEQREGSLSVVDVFELVCSRKWLQTVMVQSTAFGALLGILLAKWATNSRGVYTINLSSVTRICSLVVVYYCTLKLIQTDPNSMHNDAGSSFLSEGYAYLLASTLLRSFLLSSSLYQILLDRDRIQARTWIERAEAWRENRLHFSLFATIFVTLQASSAPITLRLFSSWIQLNSCLSAISILYAIFTFVIRALSLIKQGEPPKPSSSIDESQLGLVESPQGSARFGKHSSDVRMTNERGHLTTHDPPFCPPQSSNLCEFCSFNEQTIYAVRMNHQLGEQISISLRGKNGGAIDMEDDSPMVDLDTYQPTTMPMKGFCTNRADSMALGGTGLNGHSYAFVHHEFIKWPLVGQSWVLTFCISFNYFLLTMIPNHNFQHSESIASLTQRKASHHNKLANLEKPPYLSDNKTRFGTPLELNELNVSNMSSKLTYQLDNISTPMKKRQPGLMVGDKTTLKKLFDYRSVNMATQTFESMRNSRNPLEVIWATLNLNGWLIETLVLVLHVGSSSESLESAYFKPNRLFTPIKFATRLLIFEWLLIGAFAKG